MQPLPVAGSRVSVASTGNGQRATARALARRQPTAQIEPTEEPMAENSDRMKIVIWYAAWATACAAVAGIAIALAHTWFFSYTPTRAARVWTLIEGIETSLALAAAPGGVVRVTGGLLARRGGGVQGTRLLGLSRGPFV